MINEFEKGYIDKLKRQFDELKRDKQSLLDVLFEAELPESVYNSNAIENSTLSIAETEKILLQMHVSRDVSVREVFEAKNLARVFEYIKDKIEPGQIDTNTILLLHDMLMLNIDDSISGRFRQNDEFVRIGSYIAPAPNAVQDLVESAFLSYSSDHQSYFLEKIAEFHLEFERIHPFCDGNGRIGRLLINFQLMQLGFPPVIIRDKEKSTYYEAFTQYNEKGKIDIMKRSIYLSLLESLHKRIAYLQGLRVQKLSDFAKEQGKQSLSNLLNKAKRQTIAAFREKGIWKIGVSNSKL